MGDWGWKNLVRECAIELHSLAVAPRRLISGAGSRVSTVSNQYKRSTGPTIWTTAGCIWHLVTGYIEPLPICSILGSYIALSRL
jgi:hypothetical protein